MTYKANTITFQQDPYKFTHRIHTVHPLHWDNVSKLTKLITWIQNFGVISPDPETQMKSYKKF